MKTIGVTSRFSRGCIALFRGYIAIFRGCVAAHRCKPAWILAFRGVRRSLPSFYLLITRKGLWTTMGNTRSPHFGSVVVIDLLKKFI